MRTKSNAPQSVWLQKSRHHPFTLLGEEWAFEQDHIAELNDECIQVAARQAAHQLLNPTPADKQYFVEAATQVRQYRQEHSLHPELLIMPEDVIVRRQNGKIAIDISFLRPADPTLCEHAEAAIRNYCLKP